MRHALRVPSVRPLAAYPALEALAAMFIGEQPIRSARLCSTSQRCPTGLWRASGHDLPLDRRVDDS